MTRVAPVIVQETVIALGGLDLIADASGALYEPQSKTLIVADCHFEKGSAFTRQGHVLPPFDTRDTLLRLQAVTRRFGPKTIVSLGDGFHDRAASERLADEDRTIISQLAHAAELIWIAGNHDPEPVTSLPGSSLIEMALGDVMLRHEPGGDNRFEIAGHLHPAAKIAGRGRAVRRRCFISDDQRCIMPAFGAYAGGLNVLDASFASFISRTSWRIHALGRERVYAIAPQLLCVD